MNNKPRVITKAIPVVFIASSLSRPVNINIPFRVDTIKTKTVVYEDAINPIVNFSYLYLTSDLVKEQVIGITANDYRYASYSGADEIVYKSQQPQNISGTYNFNIYSTVGNPATVSAFALLILEFTEAEQTALTN